MQNRPSFSSNVPISSEGFELASELQRMSRLASTNTVSISTRPLNGAAINGLALNTSTLNTSLDCGPESVPRVSSTTNNSSSLATSSSTTTVHVNVASERVSSVPLPQSEADVLKMKGLNVEKQSLLTKRYN